MTENLPSTAGIDHAIGTAVTISGTHAYLQATLQLITSAHQLSRIVSQELVRRDWSDPGIVETLRAFALRSQPAEPRILVKRPQRVPQRGDHLRQDDGRAGTACVDQVRSRW